MTDRVDINRLLVEMRSMKSQTQAFHRPQGMEMDTLARDAVRGVDATNKSAPSFSELMGKAVNTVNDLQKTSGDMRSAYERGEPGVEITDVMVAAQKSSVAFQATVQVRNKLVEAYKDVMNMPI